MLATLLGVMGISPLSRYLISVVWCRFMNWLATYVYGSSPYPFISAMALLFVLCLAIVSGTYKNLQPSLFLFSSRCAPLLNLYSTDYHMLEATKITQQNLFCDCIVLFIEIFMALFLSVKSLLLSLESIILFFFPLDRCCKDF